LRESLSLNTALIEWAPKDTDLKTLWELPAFIETTHRVLH
jgi:hypothetical protein